jgi:hypothetical protein
MAGALATTYIITSLLVMIPGAAPSLNPGFGEYELLVRKAAFSALAFAIQPAALAWAFVYAGKVMAPQGKKAVVSLAIALCVIGQMFFVSELVEPEGGAKLVATLFYLIGGLLGAATPLEKPASDPPLA